ncbi:MAG: hypothetical protein AAGN46_14650 [Acidobacteriota bacterium]
MRRSARTVIIFACLAGLLGGEAFAAEHRLGIGARFFKTVDDIGDDLFDDGFDGIEEDGFSYILNYRLEPGGLIHFEGELQYFPDGFGGSTDSALSPAVLVGIGGTFYGAAGVGVTFSDDFEDDVSEPFWIGRVGWELDLLPGISLDINANYIADAFDELDDASTDAITLGALVRFSL